MLLGLITNVGTAGSTPALTPDTGCDDWWAGSQQCFVSVAIGIAAAALSTAVLAGQVANSDAGEIAFRPAQGGLPLVSKARVIRWAADDEIPQFSAPAPVVEDLDQQVQPAALVPPFLWQVPYANDEVTQTPALTVDDSQPWVGTPVLETPQPLRLWHQDEIPASATPLTVDEFYHWLRPVIVEPVLSVATQQDELGQAVALTVDFDPMPVPGPALTEVNGIIWATDEEIVPQPVVGAGSAALVSKARVIRWAANDELPQQVTTFFEEQDWLPTPVRPEPLQLWQQWFNDEIAQQVTPALDDSGWFAAYVPALPFTRVATHNDEIERFWGDEEAWNPWAPQAQIWTAAQWSDEQIVPQVIVPALDESNWTPWLPKFHVWGITRWDDELVVPPPPPIIDDVSFWKPYWITPPLADRIWTQQEDITTAPPPFTGKIFIICE